MTTACVGWDVFIPPGPGCEGIGVDDFNARGGPAF
jgi:hypothetical protein